MDSYEKHPSSPVTFAVIRQALKSATSQLGPASTRKFRAEAMLLSELAETPLGKHLPSFAKRKMAAQLARFGFVSKTRETTYQGRRRPRELYAITPAGLSELRRLLLCFSLMVPRLNPLPSDHLNLVHLRTQSTETEKTL